MTPYVEKAWEELGKFTRGIQMNIPEGNLQGILGKTF